MHLLEIKRVISFFLLLFICILPGCKLQKSASDTDDCINLTPRNDAWTTIGIGGGGAMFNPIVSPHNENVAFVNCDMSGSYATSNGGKSWRMFSLHGVVRFMVIDPLDSNIVYANSVGLFKSTDKGNTWNLLYPDPTEISGIISKGDHAEEIIVPTDSIKRNVLALAIDPTDSKVLYAAIEVNKTTGFYISRDGGRIWNNERELKSGIKNIFIDPSSPSQNRTIYITGKSGIELKSNGIWKSNPTPEGVQNLTSFSGGFDKVLNRYIIYSVAGRSYFDPKGKTSGIFYTADGGLSWENRQDGLLSYHSNEFPLPEWRAIATCDNHPEVVYVSYNDLKISKDTSCIGVAKSSDYGKTWELVWKDIIVNRIGTPSANMTADWMNDRYGPMWGENPFCIGVSPLNPELCYTTDFGRTLKTENGGKTWTQVNSKNCENNSWTSRGLDVTTGYSIVFDPFDSLHVYIPTTDIGLMESFDQTKTWNSGTKNNGVPENWENTCYWLSFDPEVKGKAWAVMSQNHDLPRPKMFRNIGTAHFQGGIVMTENGGKTWEPVSSSAGEGAFTHILIDESSNKNTRTLYACAFGKGVYKSVDGGKSWVQKNAGIEDLEPFAWQITRRDIDGALFLVISRRSDNGSIGDKNDGAIYKSVDGAENWTKILLPEGTNGPTTLAVDTKNPEQLVISAWGIVREGRFTKDTGGGIFITNDEGKNWKHVMETDQHIGSVTIDKRNNRYYACGFNGSAYYSEDSGNSWKRIRGYNFKWGQRVEPDPRDPEKVFIIAFGGGVWHGPAKGDENALEDVLTPNLHYYGY